MRTQPPSVSASGQPEQIKGVRRNMARVMADAHAKVVATTLSDDADIHAWAPGTDVPVRLIRARSAERRVGKAGVRTVRSRWSPSHFKQPHILTYTAPHTSSRIQ